jgi:hypothetical protein
VPLYKGFGFLDPRIIAAYACLALLFVAPAPRIRQSLFDIEQASLGLLDDYYPLEHHM